LPRRNNNSYRVHRRSGKALWEVKKMETEITAHEPEEEVVNTLEEIEKDVQSLTKGIIEVRAQLD